MCARACLWLKATGIHAAMQPSMCIPPCTLCQHQLFMAGLPQMLEHERQSLSLTDDPRLACSHASRHLRSPFCSYAKTSYSWHACHNYLSMKDRDRPWLMPLGVQSLVRHLMSAFPAHAASLTRLKGFSCTATCVILVAAPGVPI